MRCREVTGTLLGTAKGLSNRIAQSGWLVPDRHAMREPVGLRNRIGFAQCGFADWRFRQSKNPHGMATVRAGASNGIGLFVFLFVFVFDWLRVARCPVSLRSLLGLALGLRSGFVRCGPRVAAFSSLLQGIGKRYGLVHGGKGVGLSAGGQVRAMLFKLVKLI